MVDAILYPEEALPGLLRLRGINHRWWENLPTEVSPRTFKFTERLFGPVLDRSDKKLSLLLRLTYEWFWTDDPYYTRVDEELKENRL